MLYSAPVNTSQSCDWRGHLFRYQLLLLPFNIIIVLGTWDNPLPKTTLSRLFVWKPSLCTPSQIWLCMIIHNLYHIIKCANIPLSLSFLGHLITVGFAELIFTSNSLIRISALNPNLGIMWHLPHWEFPVRKSHLPELPYLTRQDNSRSVPNPNVNG